MPTLVDAVSRVFCESGVLAQGDPGYVYRQGQVDMANAVAGTLVAGGPLVVEAGTGVGKTYAYLVPILLSGKRAVVATATKVLQDQLALRDVPRILTLLNMRARVSVLKGRSNYLCLYRLENVSNSSRQFAREWHQEVSQIRAWSMTTPTGDLAELADSPSISELAPALVSTRESCLGSDCPRWNDCFVRLARQRALDADVVVVNHHVLFSDMQHGNTDAVGLLPPAPVLVIDEAHHLNEVGVYLLGQRLVGGSFAQFCRDVQDVGATLAWGSKDWRNWLQCALHELEQLKLMVLRGTAVADLYWDESIDAPEGANADEWSRSCVRLRHSMEQLVALLELLESTDPRVAVLRNTGEAQLRILQCLMKPTPEGSFKWVELGPQLTWGVGPVDIRCAMRDCLDHCQSGEGAPQSWIFTSSTLEAHPDSAHFRKLCGLESAPFLRIASPFDYAHQAWLYVPEVFPEPKDPLHSLEVARFVSKSVSILRGSTLVLTTSLRAMTSIGLALRQHFAFDAGLEVVIQGEVPRSKIARVLVDSHRGSGTGVVVVASSSYWEGIDVPGDALRLVVIDKLPFSPPNTPLLRARAEFIEQSGGDPFLDLFLPAACIALRQGVGRLIRSEVDVGAIAICDRRLISKGYGQTLISSLPPMQRIPSSDEWVTRLEKLTKTSTTDPY